MASSTGVTAPSRYYAAFDTNSGEVFGKTTGSHTSAELIAFLADLVAHQPKGQEIHVVLDNLSAHKSMTVEQFLEENPNVHFHFTSNLQLVANQVELWFSKITRDLLHRGVFTSVADLAAKIKRFIDQYNKNPKPVKWKHNDPPKRIAA